MQLKWLCLFPRFKTRKDVPAANVSRAAHGIEGHIHALVGVFLLLQMLFNRWKRVVRKLLGRYFEEVLLLGRTPLPAFELPVLDGQVVPSLYMHSLMILRLGFLFVVATMDLPKEGLT